MTAKGRKRTKKMVEMLAASSIEGRVVQVALTPIINCSSTEGEDNPNGSAAVIGINKVPISSASGVPENIFWN